MAEPASIAKRLAQSLIGYMSLGPLLVAMDLVFHFMPDVATVRHMHAAGLAVQSLWIAWGFLGALTIVLLWRRPSLGLVAAVVFAALYTPIATAVWGEMTARYWMSLAAVALAGYGVYRERKPA
ncbi:hypothetical protein DVT68_19940 [Dyella solisilvae]|uniref:Uncharacterized protein n=1 Tax=Dyella solisilvae TaxID=1920168 RepID=A0A370K314_9GAMM|nr:hypothetical protein DVT68_19940 [Dyella solisilvae]